MRRGAPLSSRTSKRTPVMADVEVMEGGMGGPQSIPLMRQAPPSTGTGSSSHSGGVSMDVSMGYDSKAKTGGSGYKPKVARAYLAKHSPAALKLYALVLLVGVVVVCPFLPIEWCILTLVYASCAFGAIASLWLSRSVLECDDGTAEMRAVSDPIREGASGFLHVQYHVSRYCAPPPFVLLLFSALLTLSQLFLYFNHNVTPTGYCKIRCPPCHAYCLFLPVPSPRRNTQRRGTAWKLNARLCCCYGILLWCYMFCNFWLHVHVGGSPVQHTSCFCRTKKLRRSSCRVFPRWSVQCSSKFDLVHCR